MGLCHSLRPLLFGDPEPPVEGARSDLDPMPDLDLAPVRTPAQDRRRRTEQQRAEEREARRISKSIDRRLREQRRDLRRTHRLLLLVLRTEEPARGSPAHSFHPHCLPPRGAWSILPPLLRQLFQERLGKQVPEASTAGSSGRGCGRAMWLVRF